MYNIIQTYVADLHSTDGSSYDNHNMPQFEFVLDYDNHDNDYTALAQDILILKTESLTEGMHGLGYTDFDIVENKNAARLNYYDYLNSDSVRLINGVYSKDFELFGYSKMDPNRCELKSQEQ